MRSHKSALGLASTSFACLPKSKRHHLVGIKLLADMPFQARAMIAQFCSVVAYIRLRAWGPWWTKRERKGGGVIFR